MTWLGIETQASLVNFCISLYSEREREGGGGRCPCVCVRVLVCVCVCMRGKEGEGGREGRGSWADRVEGYGGWGEGVLSRPGKSKFKSVIKASTRLRWTEGRGPLTKEPGTVPADRQCVDNHSEPGDSRVSLTSGSQFDLGVQVCARDGFVSGGVSY